MPQMVGGSKWTRGLFQHSTLKTDFLAAEVKKLIQLDTNLSVLKFIWRIGKSYGWIVHTHEENVR